MKSKEEITELLNQVQLPEEKDNQPLSIKILSVFGGILATLAFVAFLAIAGLYDSGAGLLILGSLSIGGAISLNKVSDKTITDTLSISTYIIGLSMIGFGCEQFSVDENIICLLFIGIALGSLRLVQNYILSFVSVLIISGSLYMLIMFNYEFAFNFEYSLPMNLYIFVYALITTYFFLNEAKLITQNPRLSKLYNPVRAGLMLSFLLALKFVNGWLSSVIIIPLIIYVVSILLTVLNINKKNNRIGIYALSLLLLLPTALYPAISGAMLILLLSFLVNYKTGLALSIVAFIYFICQYYYDLNFTLLTKSILMLSSGVLFIALYLFTRKAFTHEKI